MAKIINLTVRLQDYENYEVAFYREGEPTERVIKDFSAVQEHVDALFSFAELAKSPEELAKEEADKKVEEMLVLITAQTTDEQKLSMISIYPEWRVGATYSKDDPVPYVRYMDKLYKVIQSHMSQSDWTPDVAHSLFVEVLPPGTIGEWEQPTGAQDAYKIGDRVIFDGWIYCSIIDSNTWSPTAYPAGWEKEREV